MSSSRSYPSINHNLEDSAFTLSSPLTHHPPNLPPPRAMRDIRRRSALTPIILAVVAVVAFLVVYRADDSGLALWHTRPPHSQSRKCAAGGGGG